MTTLTQASRQWATRPTEERFESLTDLHEHMLGLRRRSRSTVVSSRRLRVVPDEADAVNGLAVVGPQGTPTAPTHWAFGQLCTRLNSPAGYLRTLPTPLVADCLNWRLQAAGDAEDIGVLVTRDDAGTTLRAATGPKYGRIYNSDVTSTLVERFGDGVSGDWRVPGEFGKAVTVTKANTTLYGSDRDMFVFLADETNRIEVPNRRNGQTGSMARGFFVWNSEVGAATLGIAFFLFDYVCANRIVWGATDYLEKRIRHTVSAPDRWAEAAIPMIEEYQRQSIGPVAAAVKAAQATKVDKVAEFLATRFGPQLAKAIAAQHEEEEGRPIETIWDTVTGATAVARSMPYQADRVNLERQAGRLLDLAA